MTDYSKNFLNLMGGHLDLYDPTSGDVKNSNSFSSGPLEQTADVRDILTGIVGNGYKGLTDNNIKTEFARLRSIVGLTNAQKLLTHTFVFNQRPENVGKALNSRVTDFYNTTNQDQNINDILIKAAKFGDGPIAGMNRSISIPDMKLAGKEVPDGVASNYSDQLIQLTNKKLR